MDRTEASYVIMEGHLGDHRIGSFNLHLVRVPYDIELAVQQGLKQTFHNLTTI